MLKLEQRPTPTTPELFEHDALMHSVLLKDQINLNTDGFYIPGAYYPQEFNHIFDRAKEREPELWSWLQETGTDGIHGTQSASLRSICEHGILPQKDLDTLSFPVTSVEFSSLPEPRPSVHMVHWLFASEITRYAEGSQFHLTPDNYHEAIYPEDTVASWESSNLIHFTHLRNRHLTAVALRDYLASPEADQNHIEMLKKSFPVIFGIRSQQLDENKFSYVKSIIKGDMGYEGSVESSAITCLFVPSAEIENTQSMTDKKVFALEDLRSMTDNLT